MSKDARAKQDSGNRQDGKTSGEPLRVTVISFGYKEGDPPIANLVFDVRFLKNPFWVDELRPLTGRDKAVQDYVLEQPLAHEFLQSILEMLDTLLPKLEGQKSEDFSIAFGCTGGQHRSATMAEALAAEISRRYPHYRLQRQHRELDAAACPPIRPATAAATSATKLAED